MRNPMPDKDLGKKRHILVVEDQRDLAEMLSFNLSRANYDVSVAYDGRAALRKTQETKPDLVLLDLMIPELPGTEVATRIRTDPVIASTPIIMLTAKADEVDQLVGLAVGADDYITKPFSVKVLLARVEAVLRRAATPPQQAGSRLRLGPIELDTETHEAFAGGEPVKLTLTEFRLLAALITAGGRILNRQQLMSRAIGPGVTVTERTIDVHITAVRKKLGEHGALIRTVRGVGYRVTEEPGEGEH
jgi:two-component system phosphate regulon response regulator PhoB